MWHTPPPAPPCLPHSPCPQAQRISDALEVTPPALLLLLSRLSPTLLDALMALPSAELREQVGPGGGAVVVGAACKM